MKCQEMLFHESESSIFHNDKRKKYTKKIRRGRKGSMRERDKKECFIVAFI